MESQSKLRVTTANTFGTTNLIRNLKHRQPAENVRFEEANNWKAKAAAICEEKLAINDQVIAFGLYKVPGSIQF